MQSHRKQLVLQQLNDTLAQFAGLKTIVPPKGWIRAIREALGMSGRQFAARLGVSPPRVTVMEREEVAGGLSIKTLRQAAAALDCTLVYALVPRHSLTETVREQAEKVAEKRLEIVSHSMVLEAQQLEPEMQLQALRTLADELARTLPKDLWDDVQ